MKESRPAVGMLGSVDEARDALQDAFIKAWEKLAYGTAAIVEPDG